MPDSSDYEVEDDIHSKGDPDHDLNDDDSSNDSSEDTEVDSDEDIADDSSDDTEADSDEGIADDTSEDTVDDTSEDTADDTGEDAADDSSDDTGADSDEGIADDTSEDTADDSGDDTEADSDEGIADDTSEDTVDDSSDDTEVDSDEDTADDSSGDSADDSGNGSANDSSADAHVEYETASREKYAFTIENGVVTGVAELDHGVMQPDSMESDEQYLLDGADVLKIGFEDFGQQITRYSDEDGDGLYMRVSEQWVADNGTFSAPTPEIRDPLKYFGSSGDDYIGLISDDASTGGAGADQFVFRQLGHMSIADFKHEDGDKIVFDTGLGLQSLEQLAGLVTAINYDGHDIEIEFGDMVSLTLVGCNPADFSGQEFVVLS